MNWFSRLIVSCRIPNSMDSAFCIEALKDWIVAILENLISSIPLKADSIYRILLFLCFKNLN